MEDEAVKEAKAEAAGAEKEGFAAFMSYMFPTAALEQAGVLFFATFLRAQQPTLFGQH